MNRDYTVRRLTYLARRRSTLELDQLMQRLVSRIDWDGLSDNDLILLGDILELDDLVLQKGLMQRSEAPAGADSKIWERILTLLN